MLVHEELEIIKTVLVLASSWCHFDVLIVFSTALREHGLSTILIGRRYWSDLWSCAMDRRFWSLHHGSRGCVHVNCWVCKEFNSIFKWTSLSLMNNSWWKTSVLFWHVSKQSTIERYASSPTRSNLLTTCAFSPKHHPMLQVTHG